MCNSDRNRKRSKRRTIVAPAPIENPDVPEWLTRSKVYKRLPVGVRSHVDAAILLRPADAPTVEAIAAKYKIAERFDISITALRRYARKLEQFVRPTVTSQLMAGVLGCLPKSYRRTLVAGGEVLLLSRVVKALTAEEKGKPALGVADLAKLASVLSAVGRRTQAVRSQKLRAGRGEKADTNPDAGALNSASLAEVVRELYGLSWPPPTSASR